MHSLKQLLLSLDDVELPQQLLHLLALPHIYQESQDELRSVRKLQLLWPLMRSPRLGLVELLQMFDYFQDVELEYGQEP